MWCAACGDQLAPGARACTRCGAPAGAQVGAPAPSRSRYLGSALVGAAAALVAALVAAVLLVVVGAVSVGNGSADRIEGPGYATAEKAAEAYLAAMTSSDVPSMIRTFAVETYGEHAEGAQQVERAQGWTPVSDPALPRADLNDGLNARLHLSAMSWAVYYQYLTLSDPAFDGSARVVGSDGSAQALNDQLAATFDGTAFARIGSANLVDWRSAYPELAATFEGEQNQENIAQQVRAWGADQVDFQVARLGTPEGEYLLILQLNRYGDRWWVGSFSGNLSALVGAETTAGGLVPVGDVG